MTVILVAMAMLPVMAACSADGTDPAEGWVIMVAEDAGTDGGTDAGGDGGPPADAGARDGGAPLYAACAVDADCESGVCHEFNRVGTVCTRHCQVAADCAMAGVTCNNRGLCRPP